jgi:hypothetical protein
MLPINPPNAAPAASATAPVAISPRLWLRRGGIGGIGGIGGSLP